MHFHGGRNANASVVFGARGNVPAKTADHVPLIIKTLERRQDQDYAIVSKSPSGLLSVTAHLAATSGQLCVTIP